jgi:hypothetical protein
MLDRTKDVLANETPTAEAAAAAGWLARFESALAGADADRLETLFLPDSHWRDVLALTWDLGTVSGADTVVRQLSAHAGRARPENFQIDPARAAPRKVTRAGVLSIEAMFKFETAQGRGNGIVRLLPDGDDDGALKAWTLLTTLEELKGFEEQLGTARPRGET